ncbi:MAG TPA: pilus assembly protein N-terminal domain-containing protein, partial [Bryobacteraceae bacterium]|nr:type II and III secretion system protein [Bryobacterales bacterium]HRJ18958.1 pilus assembly protein N-terminal domain-containing protein [Bryobacteraceae bacterium]
SLFAQGGAEEVRITLGKSVVIDYPEDVARISTSNPDVVDYVPVSTREILLHARGVGVATLVVWAKSGQRNFYSLSVEQDLAPVRKLLKDTFPEEDIHVMGAQDSLSLTGLVSTQAVADRALAILQPVAKSVVNHLRVRPLPVDQQILLRVKFAELNRNASESFGVNLLSTGAMNMPGTTTTQQFSAPRPSNVTGVIGGATEGTSSSFTLTDALNIFAFRPDLNLGAVIRALQQQGLLQILAEPNLVTSNGKEASFLVGGEFPVPVLQGGANAGAVTVQFREFGIRLTFNPQITENGTLKMSVKPEVSTIDLANSVNLSGFTIPALATRRIESTIELGPGQSFVIGGLIDDRANETFSRIPGLASIPLLGELFKSRSINRAKTELLVMVTPEMVQPLDSIDPKAQPHLPVPALPPGLLPGGIPGHPTDRAPVTPAKDRKDLFRVEPKSGKSGR